MKACLLKFVMVFSLLLPISALAKPPDIPDMDDSSLKIPWSDFKKILEKLLEEKPEPEPEEEEPEPPMSFSITSAHYEGKLESGAAGFNFVIKFTVLDKKQWQMVPILPETLAIGEVKLDKKPALVTTEDGWHNIALLSPGEHTATGTFFVETENRLGPSSVSFPISRTPVTTLSFSIPKEGLTIEADPASLNRVTSKGKSTVLYAVLPSTEDVSISWGRKIVAEEAELRLNAQVESLVSLGERLCQVDSVVQYEILHRGVTSFELGLPDGATLVDIVGNGVADWKVNKYDGEQKITVNLNFEAKDSYELLVSYEIALPDATAEAVVPELKVLGVTREVGYLGVAARTNIEVEINSLKDLASQDVARLPFGIANRSAAPLIFGFKYIGHPWELNLQATKHKEVRILSYTVDRAILTSFLTTEGELVTKAIYTVRNNREQFIRIKLPPNARVFNAFRNNMPVQPASDKKGRILIPLEKSTGGRGQARAFTIEITYMVLIDELSKYFGSFDLIAPETDIITNSMEWALYLPDEYTYWVKDASMEETTIRLAGWESKPAGTTTPMTSTEKLSALGSLNGGRGGKDAPDKQGRADLYMYQSKSNLSKGQVDFRGGGGKDFVQAALPVQFTVPQVGSMLSFRKTIIQENEPNTITLSYRKQVEVTHAAKRNTLFGFLLIILVFLIRLTRRRKLARKEAGQ